jgi:hypothetical protein
MDTKPVEITPLCQKHQALLVSQAGYSESDPWRALLIIANTVLFQMTSCDPKVYARVGGDVHRFKELGCLACLHPDYFGEVVQAAQSPHPLALKRLGETYIARTRHPNG